MHLQDSLFKSKHMKEKQIFLLLLGILSKANGFLLHYCAHHFIFLWPPTLVPISIDQVTIESAQMGTHKLLL